MNLLLAIIGGLVGLFVTGAALYTAWMIHQLWRQQAAAPKALSQVDIAVTYLSRWTVLDYAAIGLFILGLLLLLAELFALLRDEAATSAAFHYSYLLTGIIFCAMGMLLLISRLAVVLGFAERGALHRTAPVAPYHQHEPNHANEAE
ncbi:hypothetical protein ACFPES_00640 [Paenibacillus sp. GCM10023248]|uniref:hypothetical protein n=1 Tax=Bacillales TaxID=1385 RepID=UPI002378B2B4|nr:MULTISPECIES: hypothetical protein [Bacillales]MDD9265528.1 hypothetical protein [Paenibacillus sp. MAHUQ-63]MDR6885438.1 putative membrane protein [Bacillus sp. 3255]